METKGALASFQWRNQYWQKVAGKRCSECERCGGVAGTACGAVFLEGVSFEALCLAIFFVVLL